jgi:chemotaxis signal transduction protein
MEIVNLPGAPGFIKGMVNLRGEAIPILNLKMLFNNNLCNYESSKSAGSLT